MVWICACRFTLTFLRRDLFSRSTIFQPHLPRQATWCLLGARLHASSIVTKPTNRPSPQRINCATCRVGAITTPISVTTHYAVAYPGELPTPALESYHPSPSVEIAFQSCDPWTGVGYARCTGSTNQAQSKPWVSCKKKQSQHACKANLTNASSAHRALGTPLPWPEAKKVANQVREWGIEQLLATWKRAKGKERDALLWGDEVW